VLIVCCVLNLFVLLNSFVALRFGSFRSYRFVFDRIGLFAWRRWEAIPYQHTDIDCWTCESSFVDEHTQGICCAASLILNGSSINPLNQSGSVVPIPLISAARQAPTEEYPALPPTKWCRVRLGGAARLLFGPDQRRLRTRATKCRLEVQF